MQLKFQYLVEWCIVWIELWAFYFVSGTGNNQETPGVFNPPSSQLGEQYSYMCVLGIVILKGKYNGYLMQAPFVHVDIVIYNTHR